MPRPIKALISLSALQANLKQVQQKTRPKFLWAVVKADAYGHGLAGLLPTFNEYCDGLALLDIEDAENCRNLGWEKPILLLEGFFSECDLVHLNELRLETLVHNREQVEIIKNAELYKTLRVHIKCNSGMNRLGFNPDEVPSVIKTLTNIPNVEVIDVASHFANSEICGETDKTSVADQLQRLHSFENATQQFCLANSGAILWHPEVEGQAVRAGIAMYGVSPDSSYTEAELNLKPVMTLQSEIIATRTVPAGDMVGYGSKYKAEEPIRIGIVACGYADGYPRSVLDGWVGINGKQCKLVGTVSMDMLAVDLTDVPEAKVGTTVELWGNFPTVNQVASFANTIGYELLTKVTPRVKRLYHL